MQSTYIMLDNIRSAHNVGSIFRTADAFSVSKIFLVGTTPAPIDRFGRVRRDIAKVSLGGEKTVSWEHVTDAADTIQKLKKEGVFIVGVEQDARAESITKETQEECVLYIFGNEVTGVSKEALDLCDVIVHIPMHGSKESLNVSVAVGIVLFNAQHS